MSSTKSRIALAAVLAALSAPAFAGEAAACAVCGDPTWPALDSPAPALGLRARGGEAEALVRADPTWPETTSALPSMTLVAHPADGPRLDPEDPGAPAVQWAVELGAPASRVAAR